MDDKRRVRFATIEGLRRSDLATAGEVWIDDVFKSAWVTREAMKLATHLVRYMAAPDPAELTVSALAGQLQLGPEEIKFALRLMQIYGSVEAFTFERDEVKVALHLSSLQRLRVLEVRCRLEELDRLRSGEPPVAEARWHPTPLAAPETAG
jgi:hypothetical protein